MIFISISVVECFMCYAWKKQKEKKKKGQYSITLIKVFSICSIYSRNMDN